jgi:pyridoxal phosphate-dependent aminotransferase EpsN
MGPDERALLLEAFDSNWIAPVGPQVDAFEREFCERVSSADGAAVASGTAALHLALIILGVKPGDEVITTTFTFAATANAIAYVGARPVFVDADEATWNMSPALLREELDICARRGKLPAAVIAVDIYGQCADMDPITKACAHYGVPVVEDAAEALGATYHGRAAGTLGAMGVYSFNGNKIITTSTGGMLVSARKDWVERARYLASQGRAPRPYYEHTEIAYNYRMSNLLAAIGRGQLRVLDQYVARRRNHNAFYRQAFARTPGISFMPEAPYGGSTCWLTSIRIDAEAFGATPEEVRLHLETLDIESRPVWKPMHLQPVFQECRVRGGSVAAAIFAQGLSLPSGSSLSDEDRQRVVEGVLATPRRAKAARQGVHA